MSTGRRAIQDELEEWKRSLPIVSRGRKAAAARQLRDSMRAFTFGFRDWLEETMRPQGMTVAQLRMLFAVRYGPQASSARIARLCQVTPQTLQAMLQRAVREGWLVRTHAVNNARVLVPELTPRGDALLQQAIDATETFEAAIWQDASTADLQAMNLHFTKALARMTQSGISKVASDAPKSKRRKPKATTRR